MKKYFYSSPIGWLEVRMQNGHVDSISKIHSSSSLKKKQSRLKKPDMIQKLFQQLDLYFSGKKTMGWELTLSRRGTPFQNKVWQRLQQIPYGQTQSYSQIAQSIGRPQAVRAVGTACGKNPWLIIVPCHRVLSKTGLGGFALGLKVKSKLLHLENSKYTAPA